MRIVYGLDVTTKEDNHMKLVEEAIHAFEKAFIPGKYLVEAFPVLRHLPLWTPGVTFHKDASDFKRPSQAMRNVPFGAAIDGIVRETG